MLEAEAAWLEQRLREYTPDELSPLLNVGSSTSHFREVRQPWTQRRLFDPLKQRGIEVVHLDAREGEGIDIRADILNPADLPKIKASGVKAILCCNILEHVRDPAALAQICLDVVGPGGYVFVTVPYSYPHHRDPIDTMFRPAPEVLAELFRPAEMLKGEIIDGRQSYRDKVRGRPWKLLRHIIRLPFPFIGFEGWRRSTAKLYWLFNNYRVTVAVFRCPPMPAAEPSR